VRILYLHGLYSKPGGVKPTYLREKGFDVVNPALPDDNFAESVRRAHYAFDGCSPNVVVGSSRGGAVALALETRDVPVVLIAPAWMRWGSATRAKLGTIILHSRGDEVIPLEASLTLANTSGLSEDSVRVVGADHNMTDAEALAALCEAIREAGAPAS
jgi:hypothetical protein